MALTDPPHVDFVKQIIFPLLVVLGLFAGVVLLAHADGKCQHNQNTVDFWEEEYKSIPAKVVRVEGDEITAVIKDNVRQQVYILHTDKPKPKEGKWYMLGFCRKCHYLFGYEILK